MKKPMQFRLDPELIGRVDVARGSVSRTAFLERALEGALGGAEPSEPKPRAKSKPVRSEVERVRSEVARIGPRQGGRGAHLATCRCGLCLAGRRAAADEGVR